MSEDESPPPTGRPPAAVTSRRVLVVDDHADTAESLAYLLAMHGHEARAVTSGPAALAAVSGFAPGVCLIDLRMPEMSGYELAGRLRAALGPSVRLVAVTGELAAAADPRAAVFDRVFTKPPDPAELLRAVADGPAAG